MNAAMTTTEFDQAVSILAKQPDVQSVEEDLFTLDAMAPQLLGQVPVLFEQTVKDTLSYMLGAKESADVIAWFRSSELGSRPGVFARLLTVYGDKASPLESVIDRVFGMRVHQLVQQVA
jgi:hypothetical protein